MKKMLIGLALVCGSVFSPVVSAAVVDDGVTYTEALTNIVAAMNHHPLPFPEISTQQSVYSYWMSVGLAHQLDVAGNICEPQGTTNAMVIEGIVYFAVNHIDMASRASPPQLAMMSLMNTYPCGAPR